MILFCLLFFVEGRDNDRCWDKIRMERYVFNWYFSPLFNHIVRFLHLLMINDLDFALLRRFFFNLGKIIKNLILFYVFAFQLFDKSCGLVKHLAKLNLFFLVAVEVLCELLINVFQLLQDFFILIFAFLERTFLLKNIWYWFLLFFLKYVIYFINYLLLG